MPNIATVLKQEIVRLSRKEAREQTSALKKASAQYRKDIAEMKRRLSDLQRKVTPLEKQVLRSAPSPTAPVESGCMRFTARGLRTQRHRLGISAADYGKLVGVTAQAVYSWERETSRPRKQQVARIASLRGLGKREVRARLEQMTRGSRKKPR